MEHLKFPIGHFKKPETITSLHINSWINEIENLPQLLATATNHLSQEQLDTPYRPGGWTIQQVIHHLADSHMNSFIRFKLALTEEQPTIRPYFENRWAE